MLPHGTDQAELVKCGRPETFDQSSDLGDGTRGVGSELHQELVCPLWIAAELVTGCVGGEGDPAQLEDRGHRTPPVVPPATPWSGSRPSYPRASMARCTRSPLS